VAIENFWSPWWTMNLNGNQKCLIMMGGNKKKFGRHFGDWFKL
jgi:hypothetical protein